MRYSLHRLLACRFIYPATVLPTCKEGDRAPPVKAPLITHSILQRQPIHNNKIHWNLHSRGCNLVSSIKVPDDTLVCSLHFSEPSEVKSVEVARFICYLNFPSSQGSGSAHANNSSLNSPCTAFVDRMILILSDCSPTQHIQYSCLCSHERYLHTWRMDLHALSREHVKLSIHALVLSSLMSLLFIGISVC